MKRLFATAMLFLASASSAGEFSLTNLEKDGPFCPWLNGAWCFSGHFEGPIRKGDLDKITASVEQQNAAFKERAAKDARYIPKARLGLLTLSSQGGDLYEAMRIGQWLRENQVQVIVGEANPCYSACVFMLAGGVVRIGSNIGLHAFYSDSSQHSNFDYKVESSRYDVVEKDVRAYLTRMRVPTALLDYALQTPSTSLRILSAEEAEPLGLLVGFEPVFHQLLIAKGYLQPAK